MLDASTQLSRWQLAGIDSLVAACKEHDGNSIPIYRHLIAKRHPIACNLLYTQDDEIIGYLRSFFFFADACEITLMVHPKTRKQGIARQLLQALLPIMEQERIVKLYFSTPAKQHKDWLESLNFTYRNSEYHMLFDPDTKLPRGSVNGIIRYATSEDIATMITLDEAAFPNKKADAEFIYKNLLQSANCEIFTLCQQGVLVGKAHVFTEPDKVRLTDIAVNPDYRSQGFGSALIKHCINYCRMRNKNTIVLDVETDNQGALKLYQRLGFNIINSHDYWCTPLDCENFGLTSIIST